ncbi:hypothetical protein ACTFIV_005691 [Dictyostelium citrinum]
MRCFIGLRCGGFQSFTNFKVKSMISINTSLQVTQLRNDLNMVVPPRESSSSLRYLFFAIFRNFGILCPPIIVTELNHCIAESDQLAKDICFITNDIFIQQNMIESVRTFLEFN